MRNRWWLILGTLAYAAILLYSIVETPPFVSFGAGVIDTIDWIAACVPYFFLGALVGWSVDRVLARRRKDIKALRAPVPEFVWWTLALWLIGAVVANILAPSTTSVGYRILYLFFPIIYGVFLVPFAWTDLGLTFYSRVMPNLLFIGASAGWLALEARGSSRRQLKRALLLVVFLVLIYGTISCARQLG